MNDSAERVSEAGLAVDFSDYADNLGFTDIIKVGSIVIVENEGPVAYSRATRRSAPVIAEFSVIMPGIFL
jgi:hypothetical protein